jgi:hypothetical protein
MLIFLHGRFGDKLMATSKNCLKSTKLFMSQFFLFPLSLTCQGTEKHRQNNSVNNKTAVVLRKALKIDDFERIFNGSDNSEALNDHVWGAGSKYICFDAIGYLS